MGRKTISQILVAGMFLMLVMSAASAVPSSTVRWFRASIPIPTRIAPPLPGIRLASESSTSADDWDTSSDSGRKTTACGVTALTRSCTEALRPATAIRFRCRSALRMCRPAATPRLGAKCSTCDFFRL